MNYNGAFNPKYLSGTQLYFAKNTATPSLWNDQSPNGYDLTQGTAIQQPTIGVDSVDFDGSNDVLTRSVTNAFRTDDVGSFHFGFYYDSSSINILIGLSEAGINRAFTSIRVISDKLVFNVRKLTAGASVSFTCDTTTLLDGVYYHGYISCDGIQNKAVINGVNQILTGDSNIWFSSQNATTSDISLGALLRGVPLYYKAKINKLYYNNTILSASDLWKTEQFFANPLNYD
jgi:hypothetical protein